MITNVKEKQQEYKKKREEEWNKEVLVLFEQFKKVVMQKIDYIEDTVARDDDFLMFFIYNTSTKILSYSQKEQFSDLIKTIDLGEIRLIFKGISPFLEDSTSIQCSWEMVEEEKEEWNLWTFLYSWLK